ncbi:Golgi reassembly stacking protein 2 [Mycena indigotica]|uniref:Golgi reassembly stacking protein 2 n=1 Tax=Mycena indigotica TaxID=2126181 RepID=A0A8H6VYT1_9AGAR|nr:Golgi reassembly stacking protein 2 [Mycena indigotica]KAF7299144.1 Golgi reassembly stacking protein 2 [Mycena indigotica]
MGAGQSSQALDPSGTPPSTALHVLRVTPDSPASKTSIEPLFDFVVGFEDESLTSTIDVAVLERIVEGHEGRTLNLLVWNAKNRETRVVQIVPSRKWSLPSGPSSPDAQPSLLGLSMRMCEPEVALDTVWHVLDVLEGSPAESAGLVPYGDYITGWSGGVLSSENDFYDLVEAHIDKPLQVYVYSHDFDALREVVLVPNRHWGGEGLLGCVFGYGLLHRIPPQPADRIAGASTPPELHEPDDEFEEQELFVPADVHYPQPRLPMNLQRQEEDWHSTQVDTIQEEDLTQRCFFIPACVNRQSHTCILITQQSPKSQSFGYS